jgi:hypothetical protein
MKLTNRLLGYPQSLPTEMVAKEIEAAFDPADEGPVLLHRMSPILAHRYQSRRCNIWGQALSDYPPPHVDVARGLVPGGAYPVERAGLVHLTLDTLHRTTPNAALSSNLQHLLPARN